MVDVSIVVVSYNTKSLLDRCITTAFADSPSIDREVIVVENASSDGSLEMLQEKWPQVALLVNKENVGYARGCNQGLRTGSGRYKLALNSDAFLGDDVLGKLIDFMDCHAEVAAVAPKLLNADGSLQMTCVRRRFTFLAHALSFSALQRIRRLQPYITRIESKEFYSSTNRADVLSGACVLYRTSMLEEIGLLDERLILNCDDIEWSNRANAKGYPVVYYPEVQVVHLGKESRGFDPEGMHSKHIESLANYFDLTFAKPWAFCLKACIAFSVFFKLLKNGVLAPVVASRRSRVSMQWKLFRKSLQMLVHQCPK